jgi:glycosyltransferase involved in cell wall biosynthesis
MPQPVTLKLSICISTFNRAAFIGATLESIIAQATNDCEIVVLDGASTDNTEEVVAEYTHRFDRLRYVRQDTNNGVDRDFDRAVELASGEYCWLFSDDDLLKPGAVATVLEALRRDYSLILVNGEHRDFNMLNVRVPSFFGIGSDRVYASGDMDRLFMDVGTCLICICCVVIKRAIWLARERERYYGSRFIHVGVIFQEPLPEETLVIAEPFMSLRLGNEQTWATESFQVAYIKWPSLVWSLALSESTKRKFCNAEPWRRLRYLLALRATSKYSLTEYRRWIRPRLRSFQETLIPTLVVRLPRKLAYRLYVLYSSILGGASSPHDAFWSMFPRSLKVLEDAPASGDTVSDNGLS